MYNFHILWQSRAIAHNQIKERKGNGDNTI